MLTYASTTSERHTAEWRALRKPLEDTPLLDVSSCTPEDTNDAADCPVLTLTLADPAIRVYRAEATGGSAGPFSDRLVAVSLEPREITI